jgi:hypothetical protein
MIRAGPHFAQQQIDPIICSSARESNRGGVYNRSQPIRQLHHYPWQCTRGRTFSDVGLIYAEIRFFTIVSLEGLALCFSDCRGNIGVFGLSLWVITVH